MFPLKEAQGKLSSVFNALNSRDMQFAGFGLNVGMSVGALLTGGTALLVPVLVGLIGNGLAVYNITHPYQKKGPAFGPGLAPAG
jgi:hypothetical protein